MEVRVSVCIPCYNAENYILETLQSLLNQTYKNFEIIVIDDGSEDNSIEKIESMILKDKEFIYIKTITIVGLHLHEIVPLNCVMQNI